MQKLEAFARIVFWHEFNGIVQYSHDMNTWIVSWLVSKKNTESHVSRSCTCTEQSVYHKVVEWNLKLTLTPLYHLWFAQTWSGPESSRFSKFPAHLLSDKSRSPATLEQNRSLRRLDWENWHRRWKPNLSIFKNTVERTGARVYSGWCH